MEDKITINGKAYVEQTQPGPLTLVVLPRGFIFVGELDLRASGGPIIRHARNVRKWSTGGIGGLTRGAKSSGAVLDDHADVEYPAGTEVYVCALAGGWENA